MRVILSRGTNHMFTRPSTFQKIPTRFQSSSFQSFLAEEIRLEKEALIDDQEAFKDMKSFGFGVEVKGSECVLEKQNNGEKIFVSFNVNGTVPPIDPEAQEEIEPISYPDFHVTLEKPNHDQVAEFDCFFADGNEAGGYHIRSATVIAKEEKDQKQAPYFINSENVDPNMYENMHSYLQEKGLDVEWTQVFIDLATTIEGQAYVKKLEDLEAFVRK